MRICLLSYRGNPYCGGQGVYIYHLARELRYLGHEVYVLSGPPHPDLNGFAEIRRLESLSLYDPGSSFWGGLYRARSPLKLFEFLATCFGTFPEPFTFSIRAYRKLLELHSQQRFDIVHDNQCLGYGLLLMKRLGIPVVATIHHPISIDRKLALSQVSGRRDRFRIKRWYSFIEMQRRISSRLDRIITVSQNSAEDIKRCFNVSEDKLRVIYNGVDTDFFKGNGGLARQPNSIIAVDSGSQHVKGTRYLLQALYLLKQRGDGKTRLTLVGKGGPDSELAALVREYGLDDAVTFTGVISQEELLRYYSTAEVAVVPSLYEGFGLPAAEAMSCGLPLVVSSAGALPEVVGEDGQSGLLVPPADPDALATAIRRLLSDEGLRESMGRAGRDRAKREFSWRRAAQETVRVYEECL
ncbi:glycosyltransferase family 4 protein [Chloroflexota bacterium]